MSKCDLGKADVAPPAFQEISVISDLSTLVLILASSADWSLDCWVSNKTKSSAYSRRSICGLINIFISEALTTPAALQDSVHIFHELEGRQNAPFAEFNDHPSLGLRRSSVDPNGTAPVLV